MTTKLDLDELERKAKAATPGPWWIDIGDGTLRSGTEGSAVHVSCVDDASDRNVEHIAAASPDVVLALVARVRELEDGIGKFIDGFSQTRLIYSELRVMLAKGTVLP